MTAHPLLRTTQGRRSRFSRRLRVVAPEFNRDLVGKRKDVIEQRSASRSQLGERLHELLKRERPVSDRHGRQRTDFQRGFIDDAEGPVAAADLLHQRGILIVAHLEEAPVREHHLDARHVRPHLAELAGHRRVFRAGTGGAAHREVADFRADVELQVPTAQLLGDIDVQRPRFGGDRVVNRLKDTVHRAAS